eukprot:scaffold1836_cov204-Alexandrium_tamarense.AAC.45
MDGIVIGRSTTSNAIRVYNPRNKQYYEPDSYSIDPFRLSVSVYPTITYDGGLFCSLYRDTTPSFDEPYPPGTCVERVDPHTEILKSGTVMDISLPSSPSQSEYLIQFDNSTTATISLSDMPDLILTPPAPSSDDDSSPLLQLFLQLNSKITYEHEGQYYKGYLGVLLFGHQASSFLCTPSTGSTFDPVAHHVSAINQHQICPPTLLRALADNHPDREVWLQSYYEEKGSIESMGTFQRLTISEYRALREKGAPKAIPTMCVLTIKKDENLMPLRAKSRIVILGNLVDRSCRNLNVTHQFFVKSPSGTVSVWLSNNVVYSNKAIARMPSVMAFCPLRKSPLSVLHLAGFAANLAERFQVDAKTPSPTITPYRSGIPIYAIADSTNDSDSTAQQRRMEAYLSLVGSIGWLAQCTRPDIAPVHSFLSLYNNKPSPGHMKAALHALHYIHSTHDYGINFTSENRHPLHTYLHFPDSLDTEAYLDATPPKPGMESKLTTYSDACWGSQIGNAVREGTLLPLFKLRRMSGAIMFRSGRPIAWASERQDRTSLSSCEAEIRATNVAGKLTLTICNITDGFCSIGVPISDADGVANIWNDNEACVSWTLIYVVLDDICCQVL